MKWGVRKHKKYLNKMADNSKSDLHKQLFRDAAKNLPNRASRKDRNFYVDYERNAILNSNTKKDYKYYQRIKQQNLKNLKTMHGKRTIMMGIIGVSTITGVAANVALLRRHKITAAMVGVPLGVFAGGVTGLKINSKINPKGMDYDQFMNDTEENKPSNQTKTAKARKAAHERRLKRDNERMHSLYGNF